MKTQLQGHIVANLTVHCVNVQNCVREGGATGLTPAQTHDKHRERLAQRNKWGFHAKCQADPGCRRYFGYNSVQNKR